MLGQRIGHNGCTCTGYNDCRGRHGGGRYYQARPRMLVGFVPMLAGGDDGDGGCVPDAAAARSPSIEGEGAVSQLPPTPAARPTGDTVPRVVEDAPALLPLARVACLVGALVFSTMRLLLGSGPPWRLHLRSDCWACHGESRLRPRHLLSASGGKEREGQGTCRHLSDYRAGPQQLPHTL